LSDCQEVQRDTGTGFPEEKDPELQIFNLASVEGEFLFLVAPDSDAEPEPAQEVTGQGDDEGCVVETSDCRFKVTKGATPGDNYVLKVAGPSLKLVKGEDDEEGAGVEVPTEYSLELGRAAFGNQFWSRDNVAPGDWFGVAGMWTGGDMDCQWHDMGFALTVQGGVKKDADEVVDETVRPGRHCRRDVDSHCPSPCCWDTIW
jgi:hypothetical protein